MDFSPDVLETYINEPAIEKKVRQICCLASNLDGPRKIAWLLKAITLIDLTSLSGNDTAKSVHALCKKAVCPTKLPFLWHEPFHTAAVCVYPARIKDAANALKELQDGENEVLVACVATGFPSGQYPLKTRLAEIEAAINEHVDEVDIVINRPLAIEHKWLELYNELKTFRELVLSMQNGKIVRMKTILATGELFSIQDVYKASMVAMMAGTDFIKTSTGKETINATLPVGIVMCRAIKEFYRLTGMKVGLKPAGGIKTATDALQWMVLVKEELGDDWLHCELFRIGASSLLNNIVDTIHSMSKTLV